MRFTKMHGCGNDYIYINCFEEQAADPERLAVAVSDRHFGVGADGLVLICPSDTADFKMRMFNADGSEGKMCGNAARCVAKYVYDFGMTQKDVIALETLAGIKRIQLHAKNGKMAAATVDMGAPLLRPEEIPARAEQLEGLTAIVGQHLGLPDDNDLDVTCVSMGNPHCVAFVEDTEAFPLETVGPLIERHAWFPERVNAEFVRVIGRTELQMRVWERGSGETWACGTGACASAVACVLNGRCDKDADITVHLRGGDLVIRWDSARDTVLMTGPAAFVCRGELLLEQAAR
ncbi:MAG: diaminopimelate epimerase [Oscillospiraceae bacterium]|jgi:diaminopimelate epimerase|nr:diaminopimelate epimerase [Oscillospiraceae bacterium]